MAFWNRNRENRAAPTSGLALPSEWLFDSLGTSSSLSGKRVTVHTAIGLAPVYAAVSMIAEQVGQLPLKVYKQVDGDRVEARDHRAWAMLHDKPNEHTPADRFWSAATAQLLLWGNAFIRKHRGTNGLVDELVLLNPAHMVVYWDGDQRIKQYNYQPVNGARQIYGPDEVLHIYGLSLDGVIGESVIGRCKAAFGAALARDEFEGGFYRRGAVLSGVVEMDGNFRNNPDAGQTLKASLQALFGGSEKAHQVGVFQDGAKFRSVGSPMKDLEFVAAQQMSRTDIAVMFKLPPNYLGGSSGDSLTYATVESNQIQFAMHAIAPWTNTIAKALTSDPEIFPQNVYDCEFQIDAMLRADATARADFYQKMSGIRAMTVNEIRRLENLPPVSWGDRPSVPEQARETLAAGETPDNAPEQQKTLPPPTVPPPAGRQGGPKLAAVNGSGAGNGP